MTNPWVKWNIDFMLDPANNSPQGKQPSPFLASCEAQGPTTVVFHLKRPYAGVMGVLVERPGFIVSPAAWQKYGKDLGRHPVGSGMHQFVEWMSDDHVTDKMLDDANSTCDRNVRKQLYAKIEQQVIDVGARRAAAGPLSLPVAAAAC